MHAGSHEQTSSVHVVSACTHVYLVHAEFIKTHLLVLSVLSVTPGCIYPARAVNSAVTIITFERTIWNCTEPLTISDFDNKFYWLWNC